MCKIFLFVCDLYFVALREQQDQEHAAKMAQKLEEEEDVQMALRMQDEIMARKMHEAEAKR